MSVSNDSYQSTYEYPDSIYLDEREVWSQDALEARDGREERSARRPTPVRRPAHVIEGGTTSGIWDSLRQCTNERLWFQTPDCCTLVLESSAVPPAMPSFSMRSGTCLSPASTCRHHQRTSLSHLLATWSHCSPPISCGSCFPRRGSVSPTLAENLLKSSLRVVTTSPSLCIKLPRLSHHL